MLYALGLALGTFLVPAILVPSRARAETISAALAQAYRGNPSLNSSRAGTRAADEAVAEANAGYRPRIVGTGSATYVNSILSKEKSQSSSSQAAETASSSAASSAAVSAATTGATSTTGTTSLQSNGVTVPKVGTVIATETLFNGNRTTNGVRVAVSQDLGSREALFSTSQATLWTSIGTYRRIIGSEPTRLEAARPIDAVSPATLSEAMAVALREAPTVAEALHAVDAAATTVQVTEGQLYPTVSLVGEGQLALSRGEAQNHLGTLSASARVSVPIYEGGQVYAAVRQAKEQLAAARFQADSAREQVRANVAMAWGQLDAAKATIVSARTAVQASEVALTDVRAEASMGQRTTYDVLLAIQALFSARATLVSAQSERVVASYGLAAATGRLSATNLDLAVTLYDPTIHYVQVKDKWFGLRTPDGR